MHEVKKVYFEPEQATDVSTAEEDYEGINWRAIQEPTTWWQKLSDKVNETLDLSTAGTYPEPWWPYTNRSLYFSTHDVRLGYFKFDLRMEDNVGVFLEHMKMRAMELDIFGWASYTDTGARGECQGRIVSLDRMKVWLEKVSCPGASVIELIITDEKAGIDDLAYTCFEKRYDHPAYEKKFGQPAWWEPDYDPEAYAKRNNLPPPPKLPEGYQTIDDIFPRKRFQKKKETASAAKKKAAGKGRKGKGRRDSKSELDVLERDVVEDEVETVKMTPKEAEAFTLATAGISEIVAKNKSVEEVFMSEGPPMADETVEERVGRYCRAMGYDLERERAILGVLLSLTDEQKTELLAMKSEIEAS
uniref:Acylphosphatase-like domain-containing protein n=1 Tax=Cyanoptyche gloeocystis TaxID=77922 RepID=A0A7S2JK67_9EUKA|mmetsp:Transcript_1398/g.2636  ORF Transcript_1398/g.2636 Transcript_1398/m.2636 type:complete len:359 (+) Transcript_1398:888-1964(+)